MTMINPAPASHASSATPSVPGSSIPGAGEERVAILSGDRMCTQCGYNLAGQMIVREPRYRLLIVRCPECGTVASVQEYPMLGKWAARWAGLLAALWFIVLLGAWTGSSAAIFGMSIGTGETASRAYGRDLRAMHSDWKKEEAKRVVAAVPPTGSPTGATPSGGGPTGQTDTPVTITTPGGLVINAGPNQIITQRISATVGGTDFDSWWQSQDRAAVLAEAGGLVGAIDWRALGFWVPTTIVMFAFGCFWSLALLQLGRVLMLAWGVVLLLTGGVFTGIEVWSWITDTGFQSWRAGREQIGPVVAAITLGYCALPLAGGMLVGRSVVRLLIRALLPPRLRAPLAVLWIADGLAPPTTATRHALS